MRRHGKRVGQRYENSGDGVADAIDPHLVEGQITTFNLPNLEG